MAQFSLITIEEFKAMDFFDTTIANAEVMEDHYLKEAIYISSLVADMLTGHKLRRAYDAGDTSINLAGVKYGIAKHALHLLRNGVEYMRGQTSMSTGSLSVSTSNPEDPFYIVPELIYELQYANLLEQTYISNVNQISKNNYKNYFNEEWDGSDKYVTWNEIKYKYFSVDNVKSKNGTIKITKYDQNQLPIFDFDVDLTKLVNYILNNESVFNMLENEVYEKLLEDKEQLSKIIAKIEEFLESDEKFEEALENAITSLLENDSKFKTDLASDTNFQQIIIDAIKNDLSNLLSEQYNNLAENTQITGFNNKSIVDKVNEIEKNTSISWIEGEIKTMPLSVETMPTGWKKLSMTKGYSLIAGTETEKGTNFIGQLLDHRHSDWGVNSGSGGAGTIYKARTKQFGSSTESFIGVGNAVDLDREVKIGGSANLAAGKYVAFWQYDPYNKFDENGELI